MNSQAPSVERTVHLPEEHVERLTRVAAHHRLTEDEVVVKALDILFSLAGVFDQETKGMDAAAMSEDSLRRIWENEQDAVSQRA